MAIQEELLAFAARVIDMYGGMAERNGLLTVLLSPRLSEELQLPEEVQLGGEEHPLLYGSPLLDRLVERSTRELPFTYGSIEGVQSQKVAVEL